MTPSPPRRPIANIDADRRDIANLLVSFAGRASRRRVAEYPEGRRYSITRSPWTVIGGPGMEREKGLEPSTFCLGTAACLLRKVRKR